MAGAKILLLTIVPSVTLTPAHDLATLESEGGMYDMDSKSGNKKFERCYLGREPKYCLYYTRAAVRMRSSILSSHHFIKITSGKKVEKKISKL